MWWFLGEPETTREGITADMKLGIVRVKVIIKHIVNFMTVDTQKCAAAFGEWIALAEASTLKPFKRLAKTLSRHAQQVLNFFRYRLTSGRIERMNSMIARIQLKTRGLPSVDYLRLKLRQLTSPSFTRLL